MKFLAIALLLICGFSNASSAASVALNAEPLWGTKISLGEPVLIRVTLKNPTAKTIHLNAGADTDPDNNGIYLSVFNEKKQLLSTPAPTGTGGGVVGMLKLLGGQSVNQTYLATSWYRFDQPGKYSVRVQLLAPRSFIQYQAPLPIRGQHTVQIEVGPKDDARLKAKCEELYGWAYPFGRQAQKIRRDTRIKGLPEPMDNRVAMRALLSVRSEIALPYFVRLIEANYYSTGASLALLRLKTPRANAIVAKFATRQDNIGKAARQAQKMSLAETPITYTEQFIAD